MRPQTDPLLSTIVQPTGFPALPSDWIVEGETIPSARESLNLFVMRLRPKNWESHLHSNRALIIIHGFGEHGGRYLHFPHYLNETVGSVWTFDLRGHGRSEGLRGHVDRFDDFAEDAALVIEFVRSRLPGGPDQSEIHLLGHSLGGHIALRLLRLHPEISLCSASISAPFFKTMEPAPAVKKGAAHLLSRVWGSLQLDVGVKAETVSRDPAVVEAYRADRLNHSKMTPQFYTQMLKAIKETVKEKAGIRHPVQFLVPLADPLIDPQPTLDFYEKLKHREKRLRKYPAFFHEPFNDPEREEVFRDLKDWIEGCSLEQGVLNSETLKEKEAPQDV